MADDIAGITLLSLLISGTSTLVATLIAVPLGTFLGLREIGSARLLRTILFTLYGLPPVLAIASLPTTGTLARPPAPISIRPIPTGPEPLVVQAGV